MTATDKIERTHRTLRRELLDETKAFATIEEAQVAVDEWIHAYNTNRPHQSLDSATPASLFRARTAAARAAGTLHTTRRRRRKPLRARRRRHRARR
ncbi:transposase [Rhodococcus sp. ABRD24]|uniref:integrase core domain-containing protein n=1 Tax=Rhodococcus sp. ABRD24 TaxID=2507582 RepID=UPI00103D045A|nr:integrase core domain-containing protein [Rhodococcus sp. ABRD24]QBJ97315.1 transposase [Rhodococcus sp. ABRD24]